MCFPANWRLRDKIGQTLDIIHRPVPGYQGNLRAAVNRFFDALAVGRLVWRANWFILDSPALFQDAREPMMAQITADNAGDQLWWRVERQTLQKLAGTQAVLFTIRTHVTLLERAIVDSDTARGLAAVLRTMPTEAKSYRHMVPILPALFGWLARKSG